MYFSALTRAAGVSLNKSQPAEHFNETSLGSPLNTVQKVQPQGNN